MAVLPSYRLQSIDLHSKSTGAGFYMRATLALNGFNTMNIASAWCGSKCRSTSQRSIVSLEVLKDAKLFVMQTQTLGLVFERVGSIKCGQSGNKTGKNWEEYDKK